MLIGAEVYLFKALEATPSQPDSFCNYAAIPL